MKYKYYLIYMILNLISYSLGAQVLTLEDCIQMAKQNNLTLQQSLLEIERARQNLRDANSSFWPEIGFSSNYRKSGSIQENAQGNFSTGINAQYTIYKGGSIRANSKIAHNRIKIAELNHRQKENEIVLAVKQAFFKILHAQEQIALINTILRRRQENLTLIKLNYTAGRESQANFLLAEANLEQTKYELTRTELNRKLAQQALAQLLNYHTDEISIIYQETLIDFPEVESLLRIAKNQRPENISQIINQEIAHLQKIQAISNYLPHVAVSSSYGVSGENFLKQNDNWSVGIGLSLPIFNGLSTPSKVKQVDIGIKQNALRSQEIINSIEAEVQQAYADWLMAKQNLEVSRKSLAATENAYQLTKLQYEQGRTSYFFLQQKENELAQAENAHLNALYNLYNTTAKLSYALGSNK